MAPAFAQALPKPPPFVAALRGLAADLIQDGVLGQAIVNLRPQMAKRPADAWAIAIMLGVFRAARNRMA